MGTQRVIANIREYSSRNPGLTMLYAACAVLVCVPVVTLLVLMARYSVNVPWWDQMPFVGLMDKAHSGTLTVYDLWQQHNEHRIFVAQGLELLVGKVTGYNFQVYVFMNFLTALGSFCLLVSLLHRTFGAGKSTALLAIPFAFILFTPFQWVNWIWPFQLAFFLCVFFTILSTWLLTAPRLHDSRWIFAAAVLMATITTYCNGNGMLIWPIGLAILLWRRVDRRQLYIWCGVAVTVIASYFYKFQRSADSPQLLEVIKEPVGVLKYAFTYLGRNLAETQTVSLYAGMALFTVFICAVLYICRHGGFRAVISWTALAAYVFLTALLAAASRLNQGVVHSFISNSYPTISLLFILSTLAVTAYAVSLYMTSFKPNKLPRYIAVAFVCGTLVALPAPAFINNYGKGIVNFKDLGMHLTKVRHCVYSVRSSDDPCLDIVFPNRVQAWNDIQTLRRLHWDDF